jgi:hypothetical protein
LVRPVEVGWEATVVTESSRTFWTYLPVILLVLVMLVGVPAAYRLWREAHHEDEEPATDDERLSQLERAYYAGQMNEDEFRRIRELLGRPRSAAVPTRPRRAPETTTPSRDDPPPPVDPAIPPDSPGPS